MLDPARLRHAYDLRGRVGLDLAPDDFRRLGRTIARRLRAVDGRALVVGHDGRLSSPELAQALVAGVLAGGVDVLDIGLAPSPLAYFAERHLDAGGAAIVTASHNPADWNGMKLVLGGAVVFGEQLAALVKDALRDHGEDAPPGRLHAPDPIPAYLDHLGIHQPLRRTLRVGLDAMHGAAGPLGLRLLEGLGAEVVPLRCSVDGRFPDGPPDPSRDEHLAGLARTVVERGLDLGLALDGDGDRLVVMDGRGEVLAPDRLLVLFAADSILGFRPSGDASRPNAAGPSPPSLPASIPEAPAGCGPREPDGVIQDLLARRPGATILLDVKGSLATRRAIEAVGGTVELVPSGHAHMRAAMRRTHALLGGELSGHLFFADNGYDDGLDAAARLLRLLADRKDSPTAVFDRLPRAHATPELQIPRPASLNVAGLLECLAEHLPLPGEQLLRIDGLRLESPAGFILVRASNTLPLLTLRIEGEDEAALARLKSRLIRAWPTHAPPLPHPLA